MKSIGVVLLVLAFSFTARASRFTKWCATTFGVGKSEEHRTDPNYWGGPKLPESMLRSELPTPVVETPVPAGLQRLKVSFVGTEILLQSEVYESKTNRWDWGDVQNVVEASALEAGVAPHRLKVADRKVVFDGDVDPQLIEKFKFILEKRASESVDPEASRNSRHLAVRLDVNIVEAREAEQSGFSTAAAVEKEMGELPLDSPGRSKGPNHADFPHLTFHEGVATVWFDPRFYEDFPYHMKGIEFFPEARKHYLGMAKAEGNAWVVFTGYTVGLFGLRSDTYHVFSTKERAENFVRTHFFRYEGR